MSIYLTGKQGLLKGRALKSKKKSLNREVENLTTGVKVSRPERIPVVPSICHSKTSHSTPGLITIEDVRQTNERMRQKTLFLSGLPEDKYSKMGDEILMKIRKKINRNSINETYKEIISKKR